MIIAKVTGSVVSTRKNEKLVGSKFMIVEPLGEKDSSLVAIDDVGAGIGEYMFLLPQAVRQELAVGWKIHLWMRLLSVL